MNASITAHLAAALIRRTQNRLPDFIVGGAYRPYLLRWYITPFRRWSRALEHRTDRFARVIVALLKLVPNIYLHQFLRSDDDRALHDHPWLFNASVVLSGQVVEHTIAAGGIHHRRHMPAGAWRVRLGPAPHRIELVGPSAWTLFITGPVVRGWGFHCPERGWVHWRDFTAADDAGAVGKGCGT